MKASGKDTKSIVGKEIKFMKKGGAPKSLIKHEQAEHAGKVKMRNGGKAGKRKC
jgi:hypothetical protein